MQLSDLLESLGIELVDDGTDGDMRAYVSDPAVLEREVEVHIQPNYPLLCDVSQVQAKFHSQVCDCPAAINSQEECECDLPEPKVTIACSDGCGYGSRRAWEEC